ncbi:hypothetical protein INR49_018522 [Caranx melampygus]|nr:hypothetical protein INR49_018522 [Caranx melampygus]
MEFQDARGRKETLVSSIKKKPHQENLENQDVLDLEDQRENQEVQVITVFLEPQENLEIQVNKDHQGLRDTQDLKGLGGFPGVKGLKGQKGDFIVVDLKGEKGNRGPNGPPGRQGNSGRRGRDGLPGIPGNSGAKVTLCPVYPKTRAPQERRETLGIQVTQDSLVLQVFVGSLDLMELKETKERLDFLDYLDDKVLQELLETLEKRDLRATVMKDLQAILGLPAFLGSRAHQGTLMLDPQDLSASQDQRALWDRKECLESRVSQDALEQRA